MISTLRVPQLQGILQFFDPQRSNGRKSELITRIYNLLRDKKTQGIACQRIREVTRTNPLQSNIMHSMRNPFAPNQFQRPPPYFTRPPVVNFGNNFMPHHHQGNNVMNIGGNGPVVMPSRTGGRAERMSYTRLPFFDEIAVCF